MKRILSLILSLSMLFSVNVYAAGEKNEKHELDLGGYEQYLQVLKSIGVELPILELSAPLKKGDFIKSINSFFGYSNLVNGGSVNGSYEDNVNVAYSAGIILEQDKEEFNPEEPILLCDAVEYIVNALGHNKKFGFKDSNYESEAAILGIYNGVTTGWNNPISSAQMLKLFYNTMEVNIFEYKGANYYEEGDSMLYEVHDVEILKGIVTANYKSGLSGTPSSPSAVEIDEAEYECEQDTDGLIGKYTISFIRDDVVLYIVASAKKNEILKIDNEDIYDFSDLSELSYFDEKEKVKKIDFDYPPSIFVNGKLKPISSVNELDDLIGENGEFEAIDNDNDGAFEVVNITNYVTYVVDRINYNKGIITDSNMNKLIEFNPEEHKLTVIKDGAAATFEDIKAKEVIEVSADGEYVNADGERVIDFEKSEYITIIVTSASVGGIVNKIDEKYIEIDETEYELSDYLKMAIAAEKAEPLQAGMSGAFYENRLGKIVYINTAKNALDKYGFLVWGTHDVDNDRVIVRMFTSGETIEILEFAEKVTVDGETKKSGELLLNADQLFSNIAGVQKIKNQLVIYRLNADGEINYIDTALVTGDNEDKENALRLDMEFYGNSAAEASETLINKSTSKYNGPGEVFTHYSTGERYSNINIKPSSEMVFVVSGFLGDTEASDYETNKNQYMLEAHDNMQIAEPMQSADNFEVTTSASKFSSGGDYNFHLSGRCIKFYNIDDDNSVQYMVYYDPALSANSVQKTTGGSTVAFYSGQGKTVNKDGEVTDYLKVCTAGSSEEKLIACKNEQVMQNLETSNMDSGNGALEKGDIIRYTLNINGEIAAIKRDVDFVKMKKELDSGEEPDCFASCNDTGIESSNSNYDTVVRWLGTNGDTFFTLMSPKSRWSGMSITEAVKKPAYRAALKKTSNVLIYDVKEEIFRTGTLDDLFTAKECGESASVLYVRQTVSQANLILAYNFK